jgi:hypothetical protein
MARVDLDALKRARAEAQKEPNEFVFGGKVFTLPFEMPLDFLEALLDVESLAKGKGGLKVSDLPKLRNLLAPVLDGQAEEFFALHPAVEDYVAIIESIGEMYVGASAGESSASGSSSKTTMKSSRQPSRKSTPRSRPSPTSSGAKSA